MSSRTNSTAKNFAATLVYQCVAIIFGFIIPRLFLDRYGADIHGLISSVSNMMAYVVLLNAGLASASIQALYGPLALKDTSQTSSVLNAVNRSFLQTGIAYLAAVVALAFILPYFTERQVPGTIAFLLMIIMGSTSIAECFIYSKFNVLLLADQKLYFINFVNVFALVLRGILQFALIKAEASILLVQAVPVLMLFLQAIFLNIYVRKHYPALDRTVPPDKKALSKRWAAFVHQITGVVQNNTSVVLLMVFGNLILVSIYSVYQMVFSNLFVLMTMVFSQASIASFGQLLALKDKKTVRENYNRYEFLYDMSVSVVYSICAVMILPFVGLYTQGVANIPYVDGRLAFLFVIIGIANNLRVPGLTVINAAGLYRETKWRAIAEAAINITVSVSLVGKLGIIGVLLGSIASFGYRTLDIIFYSNRKVLNIRPKRTVQRALRAVAIVCLNVFLLRLLNWTPEGWSEWVLMTLFTSLISIGVTAALNTIFEYRSMAQLLRMLKSIADREHASKKPIGE